MKVTKKEVENWLRAFPQYRDRALMYDATCLYVRQTLGDIVTKHHVQMSILVHRRLQEIIPLDKRGIELEAEYRDKEMGMKSLVEFAEEALNGRRVIERDGQRYYLPR